MPNSRNLAQFIGPILVALASSEALNLKIWATNSAPLTYLNGCILLVAGLSIVRAHSCWTRRWPVLITLLGWGATLGGLFRMFLPRVRTGGENAATYAVLAVLFAVGIVLTLRGYLPERH